MVRKTLLAGLGLVAGATLMLEVVLTRVFSVIMWYHMSLVAVSMAMFGMTLGALIVHWRPAWFRPEVAALACSRSALAFGISTVISLLTCLNTPFRVSTVSGLSLNGIYLIAYWNAVAAIPFIFSGICVCTALTRFPRYVGKLYAADLAGASVGCIAIVWLLSTVDALSGIMLVAGLAVLASLVFAVGTTRTGGLVARAVLALVIFAAGWANASGHAIRVQYALDRYVGGETLRHEYWNAFSFIGVSNPIPSRHYHGRGGNADQAPPSASSYLLITMDTRASTPMVQFNPARWGDVDWLMYDATNLVHNIRRDGPVLVIGSGGGRDVLSALLPTRGQRDVTGVDINPHMIKLLTDIEADFAGHLERLPHTRFFNDEARSWVARSQDKFQVITIPLVDTSAASAAGAYALTENSLYTVEAFELFWDHLADDGVLSVSRWWNGGRMGETHRLAALAAETLRRKGVANPRNHVVIGRGGDLTTLLLSRRELSGAELTELDQAAVKHGFGLLLSPRSGDAALVAAVEDPGWSTRTEFAHVDVTPPTDDRPFFFHSYRMGNLFRSALVKQQAGVALWDKDAMVILLALVLLVTVLAVAVVVVPLLAEQRRSGPLSTAQRDSIGYFAAIGIAFMLFEAAQMQRLNLFLGNPIYALTVVLFGLLLSSSLGAYIFGRWARVDDQASTRRMVLSGVTATLVVLIVLGLLTPIIAHRLMSQSTPVRITVAVLLVAPAGVFMGMFFPLGVRLGGEGKLMSLAWYWAINGMASTCAAVYGIALAISFGFQATYWCGVLAYLAAGALALRLTRNRVTPATA